MHIKKSFNSPGKVILYQVFPEATVIFNFGLLLYKYERNKSTELFHFAKKVSEAPATKHSFLSQYMHVCIHTQIYTCRYTLTSSHDVTMTESVEVTSFLVFEI